jgi:homoprotocatechuate degradation regulator HpaR
MRAREGVMQRFRPHLRNHDITEQQWRILRVLAEQTTADMLELSTRCCIHPPSLSRTVPLLATRGLVKRSTDANDQRRIFVTLTREGKALFKTMSSESARIYEELEAEIGPTRLAKIYRMLDELIAIADFEDRGVSEDE